MAGGGERGGWNKTFQPKPGVMGPQSNPLRLELIDVFRVSAGGGEVTLSSAAGRLVLGYLALCAGKSESRSKLAAVIWEDSDEFRARRNLRQVLHHLRSDLDMSWEVLVANRSVVSLEASRCVSDFEELVAALQSGTVPDYLNEVHHVHERLLAALPEPGELFVSWLRLKRAEFENGLRTLLEQIVDRDDPLQAERAARALLNLDASDENAARRLIALYHDRGDTGRALGVYKALWDHLDEVYGMEPAGNTQELIAAVKSGGRQGPEVAGKPVEGAASARKFSIAVLPVSAAEPADEVQLTAEIFRAELMSRLVRFREFDIIDMAVRDAPADYRLKLLMAPSGAQLVLIVSLTRDADGVVVWSDRYDQVTRHWRRHQVSLAGKLAAACSLSLSRARLSQIDHMSCVSDAVDNWLIGQKLLHDFRSDRWEAAAGHFRAAIDLDPGFSMAYSSLSQHNNIRHLVRPGITPERTVLQDSKNLANKAIALDPLDSRAHLARAWASCLLGEYAQSAAGFAMARQCNENDPWTVLSSALGAAFGGDLILANALADRFLQEGWTTTMPHWGYHANIRFLSADDEGCIAAAENAGTAIINLPGWKAAALWHVGERENARAAWRELEANVRNQWAAHGDPSSRAIFDWFLACFPIRMRDARQRLATGAAAAAGVALSDSSGFPPKDTG